MRLVLLVNSCFIGIDGAGKRIRSHGTAAWIMRMGKVLPGSTSRPTRLTQFSNRVFPVHLIPWDRLIGPNRQG
jgi:hypothetical protein